MRTTVDVSEDLIRQAKERAVRTGQTLGQVVEDALRSSLARPVPGEREPVRLPTFGGGGLRPGVDLDDSAALLDLIDEPR